MIDDKAVLESKPPKRSNYEAETLPQSHPTRTMKNKFNDDD